ncbi:MAG: hypothetical protein C0394_05845 [Syntrophus sp. (in: bacteria)]|nr:hypothetical protein [Syntrophus sp. (in: bacteria)]
MYNQRAEIRIMDDDAKTSRAFIEELSQLRNRVSELEQSLAEESLKTAEVEERIILDSMTEMLAYYNSKELRIQWANRASGESLKMPPHDLVGRFCYELWHKRNEPCEICPVSRAFETGKFQEEEVTSPDGKVWHIRACPVLDAQGETKGIVELTQDITDRKRAEYMLRESEERYRELSIIDDLTQLYNSRHFYHRLRSELDRVGRYGQPLTLLLLDIDDFKVFNDTFGHIEGDVVLSRLGQVITRCLRQTDSAYRYGGEEFTILLPVTTSEDGAVTAERIRTEFKKESFSPVPGKDVHLTVSIGLSQYNRQEDMKAFVHRVDQLMYQGKKNGKDRVCFES